MSLEERLYVCKSTQTEAELKQLAQTQTRVRTACDNELMNVKGRLVSEYWTTSPSSYFVEVSFDDALIDGDSKLGDETIVGMPIEQDGKLHVYKKAGSTKMPEEDITVVKRPSDLTLARRVNTKFTLFKNLKDESDVIVHLRSGEPMRVRYQDIRFVESFLFRTYTLETDAQRKFMSNRIAPNFACVERIIPRLTFEERAIVFSLISCTRCRTITLVIFLNMKLHQLSAFTAELIRRGESMDEVLEWYMTEYMDTTERRNMQGVFDSMISLDKALGQFILSKWKLQHNVLRTLGNRLIDMCVDSDSMDNSTEENETTKFYHKILHEISSIDCKLELEYQHRDVETFCKLLHLTQLSETAYTMTTPTLKMAIQSRIDLLLLIITEHNMRAQNNALLLGKHLYRLAYESTVLASELLRVSLYYDRHLIMPTI